MDIAPADATQDLRLPFSFTPHQLPANPPLCHYVEMRMRLGRVTEGVWSYIAAGCKTWTWNEAGNLRDHPQQLPLVSLLDKQHGEVTEQDAERQASGVSES